MRQATLSRMDGPTESAHATWWRFLYGGGEPYRRDRIGLALGGGFARGISHIGVLQVLEENRIPLSAIVGVSSGSIIAAAYASGTSLERMATLAGGMKFNDVARWTLSTMGLMRSERMTAFLRTLLPVHRFEDMRIPLGIVATDLRKGESVLFQNKGEVFDPIRASCAYPGLFRPVNIEGRLLVDGGMSLDVPAPASKEMGARHTIAVSLDVDEPPSDPTNMAAVINRCVQILQTRTKPVWAPSADVVLEPRIGNFGWDKFDATEAMIASGRRAAEAELPRILAWLD